MTDWLYSVGALRCCNPSGYLDRLRDEWLDADVVIAFLDPGDREHATAVAELRPRLAAGDKLLVAATVYAESIVRPLQNGTDALTLDKKLGRIARRVARHPDDLRRELSRRGFRALQEEPGVTPVDARQE